MTTVMTSPQAPRPPKQGARGKGWKSKLAIFGGAITVGVCSSLLAWALFSASSSPQTNGFTGGSLPQGATPAAIVSPANSPTVSITFAAVNDSAGTAINTYQVSRYTSTGTFVSTISGSCSVSGSSLTCTDQPTDGTWKYADIPTEGTAPWKGTQSAFSNQVLVDTTAPTVTAPGVSAAITYGTNPIYVSGEQLNLTENATDSGSGVASVSYYYCAGSGACSSWTLIGTSSSTGTWPFTWPAVSLPAGDGVYQISVTATDNVGNTSGQSGSTFIFIDRTAPTVPAPGLNGHT